MGSDLERFLSDYRRARGGGSEGLVLAASTESTNRLGRQIAGAYHQQQESPPWCLVAALEQTAGRGRLEREWRSPPGAGLYATILLPIAEPGDLQILPVLSAVAFCSVLDGLVRSHCRLKWPNDLVVEGRKLGGVLIQVGGRGEEGMSALVGVGVNLSWPERELSEMRATSLERECPRSPAAGELAATLYGRLVEEWEAREERSALLQRYREILVHRPGDRVKASTPRGTEEGVFLGVDDKGFLHLSQNGREAMIEAGEIVEE